MYFVSFDNQLLSLITINDESKAEVLNTSTNEHFLIPLYDIKSFFKENKKISIYTYLVDNQLLNKGFEFAYLKYKLYFILSLLITLSNFALWYVSSSFSVIPLYFVFFLVLSVLISSASLKNKPIYFSINSLFNVIFGIMFFFFYL